MKTHHPPVLTVIPPPAAYPPKLLLTFWIFVAAGIAVVAAATAGFATQRTWISYLINFCFWSGLAQAGIVFSAAYRLTNGRWGETIRRVAEGFVLFIPLSVLLFLVTYFGRTSLWPWITEPIEAKAAWLNEPFFFARVIFYYLFLSALSLWYVSISIRPELGLLKEQGLAPESSWVDRLTANWRGYEAELETRNSKLAAFVPGILVAYGVVYTFVGFDVVMSLDPHWYSSLYGWLYLVHAFDAGVAGTIIVAILSRKYFALKDNVSTKQFYDVSRLLMGLCMLAGGFYWGQFITIWYGNLGEEIERILLRFDHAPWPAFQWAVIAFLYFFPIVVFLSRNIKEKPRALIAIASVILAANWFYQFVEIAPAVWKEASVPLGIPEIAITLGFLGATGLCWLAYAKLVPLVPAMPEKSKINGP
ncbi:MAG: hypothetical protein HYW57_05845 [Ignavibacteriales bacterium]|nr:hypothetical protein [Ignavibacteriales bacterium]